MPILNTSAETGGRIVLNTLVDAIRSIKDETHFDPKLKLPVAMRSVIKIRTPRKFGDHISNGMDSKKAELGEDRDEVKEVFPKSGLVFSER